MRFLLFLRDRVLPYLLLLCIIIGGLGAFGWFLAQTYFWNTSQITFLVDEEIVSAKVDISARIIYRDFMLFESNYPVRITLPFSREIYCTGECIFTDIPAGDARVTFVTKTGNGSSEQMVIQRDTEGTIDMRMSIRVVEIPLSEVLKNDLDTQNISLHGESIVYKNIPQGLSLFYDKGILFLYDGMTQQSMLLENATRIRSVTRGVQEGEYYLVNAANEVLLYDRYGRKKTEKVTHSALGERDLIWELRDGSITTKLIVGAKERIFSGRLFWFEVDKKQYLFDGGNIFDIINN